MGILTLAPNVNADDMYSTTHEETETAPFSYGWRDSRLRSEIGVGVTVGGGVTGFTDAAMRDVMRNDAGGLWDLRASIGTHTPIGLDISYLGTAASLQTLDGSENGTLIGTTVEGAIRYNVLPHFEWNPYIFAGMGWQRYDVTNTKFAQSDTGLRESDNLVEFPMGAGLSYRDRSGLVVDLHGTFRAAGDSSLLTEQSGDNVQLHTWEASGAIGYEF
ncbi:MAG: outer membrane beta-barrel protein [Kofleriaceae bacterium]|nr:outer membrane beta-barrel protein [Kofleriaceae bacterium]